MIESSTLETWTVSYPAGRVEKVVKRVDIPGTFIVTVHTPYTYKVGITMSIGNFT